MEDKADEFRRRKKSNQLLLVACARGYLKDVEVLTEEGADLGCKDKQGLTPLHFAAGRGYLGVVQFLWSKGAEVDAEAPDGRTPLHLAAQRGHPEVVRFFIQKGAWTDAYDAKDNTPLHLAARYGQLAAVQLLLEHGAAKAPLNKRGLSPAAEALLSGHEDALAALTGWGAELGERPRGFSLLHLAAGVGRPEAVEYLLERGMVANDSTNDDGATPLHAAALSDRDARCAELLLKAGADASLADAAGEVAADFLPRDSKSPEVAKLRELLQQSSPRHQPAQRSSDARDPQQSPQAAFRALPLEQRLRKVERWSMLQPSDLDAALEGLPPDVRVEIKSRLGQATAARCSLNIQKAMAALHADQEFQSDMAEPKVASTIDAIKANPVLYEHATRDPQVAGVLLKMRRVHAAAQANGQRTVSMNDMVVAPGADWKAKDQVRQAELEGAMQAHFAATAAAAAVAEGGSAAGAAAEAFAAEMARAGAAAAAPTQKAPTPSQSSKLPPAASSAAPPSTNVEPHEDKDIPEWMRGGFTWKKLWAAFLKQMLLSLSMLLVFLLASWVVRGRPPWEGRARPADRQAPVTGPGDAGAGMFGDGVNDEL